MSLLLLAASESSAMASMDELEASVLVAVVAFVADVGCVCVRCVCVMSCGCIGVCLYVCVHVNRLNKSLNYS